MKYFIVLFLSLLFLTSCDDGKLITQNFVFDTVSPQKCASSNVLYKINANEALILSTPDTSFPNIVGVQNIPLSASSVLVYKKFSSTTNTSNICDTPTIPILEQWNVIGGSIQITTSKIFDTSGLLVVAYNHNIVFKNITFVTPEKQIVYDSYIFGDYRTEIVNLNFDYATATTQKCSGNNLIFKYNNSNAILLDVNQSLFTGGITTPGNPRKALINTTNKVIYRIYNGNLNTSFFCSAISPSSPVLTEEWLAQDGVLGTSGEIRVTTVALGAQFKHTITLYKTTFKKGVLTYIYPTNDSFVFGDYITN